ncbi:TetR family transcriptional regulator [Nocardia rhizosphaerihabitans]|uniref:TetR family transcriptional regulator n=1 Tax=Nocardia rhizosphaerihabitans TaxID=1691570 RepID=A0ABQ2K585_9NOCA|nr:TetR family transcriptional regulator [Nocardia rhizosphaerihabitans]
MERHVTVNIDTRIVGTVTAPFAQAEQPVGDGRATRWHGHKARRRAEMIDAAIEVIEEHGLEISVQLIAEHLALPRPVVYRHVGGRAELDALARQRILELLLAELLPALEPDGTLKDAVRGAIGTYLGWIERHPNLHRFLGDAAPEGTGTLAGAGREVGGQLADMFAASLARFGIDPARARPMAFGMVGLVDGVVASWRADPEPVLTTEQVQGILTESVLSLFEGNARSLGVPLERDSLVADLLVAPDAAPPPAERLR